MTINVEELRQHLAWFDDPCTVRAVDESGRQFDIVAVGDAEVDGGAEVRLVVREVTAA